MGFPDVASKKVWAHFVTKLRSFVTNHASIGRTTKTPGSLVLLGLLKFASHFPFHSCWVSGLITSLQTIASCELQFLSCVKHSRIVDPCFNPKWLLEMFLHQVLLCQPCEFSKEHGNFPVFGFVCPLSIELLLNGCFP